LRASARSCAPSAWCTPVLQRGRPLTAHRVKLALRDESTRAWHEVEADFVQAEYRAVRDRQMRELEDEDALLARAPVRALREKLYNASAEFVRQQRLQCLLAGAWFARAAPRTPPSASGSGADAAARRAKPWRFLRLDAGMRVLHFVDAPAQFAVRPGVEDLPERIDVALVHEVATGTGRAPPELLPGYAAAAATRAGSKTNVGSVRGPGSSVGGSGPDGASALSFALLNTEHGPLAELLAPDAACFADWTDGLNMLRREGGHGGSKETAAYVHALTEIGLKIRLLGACVLCAACAAGADGGCGRPVGREGADPKRDLGGPAAAELGLLFQRAELRCVMESESESERDRDNRGCIWCSISVPVYHALAVDVPAARWQGWTRALPSCDRDAC
jgi:engulfment/cell motility protein 1